jgi:hypothetical protein
MLTVDRLRDLVRLSFVEPRKAGEALIGLAPPMEARWLGMAAAVVVGVVVAYLLPAVTGQLSEAPPPMAAVGVQLGANLVAAVLMATVGRTFGGQGGFADALLLVGWLQAMMVLVQAAQVVALIAVPPVAGLLMILAIVLFFWMLTGFVQALHGFTRPMMVLLGTLGALFAAAFVASFVLLLLGFDPRGLTDV